MLRLKMREINKVRYERKGSGNVVGGKPGSAGIKEEQKE